MIELPTMSTLFGATGVLVALWCTLASVWTDTRSSRQERKALAALAAAAAAYCREQRKSRLAEINHI